MILGPVFNAELVTTSRRRRYYLARLIYGLILLGLVAWTYQERRQALEAARFGSQWQWPSLNFLSETAEAIFTTFLATQVAAVLALTPALVAGTIADEKQRKTLHYLLASQLSSREIVCGKLGARLILLFALVLTGLPIMSILSLFGGLDPPLVLVAFLGTLTTAFALASLSILVSAVSRRARDAIVVVYILEVVWLAAPWVLAVTLGTTNPETLRLLTRLATGTVAGLDPFQLAGLARPTPDLLARLAWMAGLQTTVGLVFVALAVWRLRPSYASGDRVRLVSASMSSGRFLPRLFGRPGMGDDPLAWKERHVARLGSVLQACALLGGVFAFVFLGDTLLDHGRAAFGELWRYGYGGGVLGGIGSGDTHHARNELQGFVAMAGAVAYVIWMLGLASTTAAGIASEREDDTWLSLLGTMLDGREILRAKALGALWRWRWVGRAAVGMWTFGLLLGAIHPLAYVLTLMLFAVYSSFALALGTRFSLAARSTSRAMTSTLAVLFALNVGYLIVVVATMPRMDDAFLAPCSPYAIGIAPAGYATVKTLLDQLPPNPYYRVDLITNQLMTCLVGMAGYGLAAVWLGWRSLRAFDRIADRPRRPLKPAYVEAPRVGTGKEAAIATPVLQSP
jgi:ABC-type transport system involved in multi-copper enzyme maturation permease subunit